MKIKWSLKILSLALLLTLVISVGISMNGLLEPVQAQPGETAEGTIEQTGRFSGGSGTPDDPYLVATPAELKSVRELPEAYFQQVKDIDLDGINWEPIGSFSERFSGQFDGGEFIIKNLTIYYSDFGRVGLFGHVDGATLQNIFLKNVNIEVSTWLAGSSAAQYVGGLAGVSSRSNVENVHVIGEANYITLIHDSHRICHTCRIGGLVGVNETNVAGFDGRALIHYASINAQVVGNNVDYVGGLVGNNFGTIRHSFSEGGVSGERRVGGLVGNNAGVITDSYSQAEVSGFNQVGGFAGASTHTSGVDIHRSYSTGMVYGEGEDVGGFMGEASSIGYYSNCYWDIQTSQQSISAGGSSVLGLTTEELQMEKTYRYFNFNTLWQIDEEKDYPVFQDLAAYDLPQRVNLDELTGSGSEDDPYIITNADELNAMRQDLTASYQLGNDIDLSASVAWKYGRGWMEVGSSGSNQFTGSFDGVGFKIENLTMNRPRRAVVNYYMGLFGNTDEISFKNLRLEDVNIHCYRHCGALAGRLSDGDVENVSVSGIVFSHDHDIGGVFGVSYPKNRFQNIIAEVDVHGRDNIGGIGGRMASSVLHSAVAVGSVQGADRVGGLMGAMSYSDSAVTDSFNRASVSGQDEVGGLVGFLARGAIEHSYSTGHVTGTGDYVGGLVGRNTRLDTASTTDLAGSSVRDDGGVSDSYWNTETSNQEISAGGLGRTTDEMTYPYAANTYVGWDFVHIWGADSDHLYNAGYPFLQSINVGISVIEEIEQLDPMEADLVDEDSERLVPELLNCFRSIFLIIAAPTLIFSGIFSKKILSRWADG